MKITAKGVVELVINVQVTPREKESLAINVIFDMLRSQQYDVDKIIIEKEPMPEMVGVQ